jgi:SAM-dependent methyltransferase
MPLAIRDAVPDVRNPGSQACTQAQFETPEFEFWCREIREPFRYHRKLWEYCYLLQALATNGMIAPGRRGVGFGVGKEMTVAVLAARGVHVTATDLDLSTAQKEWVETGQHAAGLADLNDKWICPPDLFARLVDFRVEDMNAISPDLTGYDFAWSLCAFEHLGSIPNGLAFVKNSLKCVRPGGILVHTSELNCFSDDATLDSGPVVIFRRQDFTRLAEALTAEGHHIELNFNLGTGDLDRFVDVEPYTTRRHLRLSLGGHVTTSFGLIVRKAG